MSIALLVVIGNCVGSRGVGVTFSTASAVPQVHVAARARHGRYAGLTADDQDGGSGTAGDDGPPNLGHQTINAI